MLMVFEGSKFVCSRSQRSEKSMNFSINTIKLLQSEYTEMRERYNFFRGRLITLPLNNEEAKVLAQQGFGRRIIIIHRCIENIFRIYPLDADHKPNLDELSDLDINLQAFIFNVYGALDNLAWVWVKEKNIVNEENQPLSKWDIGFKSTTIRKSFSLKFQEYLQNKDDWFDHIKEFRHALAHRIPPYVPPFKLTSYEYQKWQKLEEERSKAQEQQEYNEYIQLSNEITNLGTFIPAMLNLHSKGLEGMMFHPQIIVDWKTVMEIWDNFLEEIKLCKTQQPKC